MLYNLVSASVKTEKLMAGYEEVLFIIHSTLCSLPAKDTAAEMDRAVYAVMPIVAA